MYLYKETNIITDTLRTLSFSCKTVAHNVNTKLWKTHYFYISSHILTNHGENDEPGPQNTSSLTYNLSPFPVFFSIPFGLAWPHLFPGSQIQNPDWRISPQLVPETTLLLLSYVQNMVLLTTDR